MCEFDRISSKKIVIDPYRGGDDIGKTKDNLIEKDFNLEISKYIYDKLKEKNIPVSLTRNNDETLSIEDRTNKTRRPVSKDELNISFINIYPRFYLLVIYQDVANAFLFKISNKTNNVN